MVRYLREFHQCHATHDNPRHQLCFRPGPDHAAVSGSSPYIGAFLLTLIYPPLLQVFGEPEDVIERGCCGSRHVLFMHVGLFHILFNCSGSDVRVELERRWGTQFCPEYSRDRPRRAGDGDRRRAAPVRCDGQHVCGDDGGRVGRAYGLLMAYMRLLPDGRPADLIFPVAGAVFS